MTRDDDFEVAVFEGVFSEDAESVVHQACVSVLGDFSRVVVKTNPGRGHDVRVDVVEEVVNGQIFHTEVKSVVELLLDEVQILGQKKHALSWCQGNVLRRFVAPHASPSGLFTGHPFIIGSGHQGEGK